MAFQKYATLPQIRRGATSGLQHVAAYMFTEEVATMHTDMVTDKLTEKHVLTFVLTSLLAYMLTFFRPLYWHKHQTCDVNCDIAVG